MSLYRAARAVAEAEGDGPIDWSAVGTAAREGVAPGDISLTTAEREGYASDVLEARRTVAETAAIEFDLPERIQIQHRHHWIDANLETFRRLLSPLESAQPGIAPSLARTANTGSLAVTLGFLAKNVLGQYDPLLLADGSDHELYFVHPNIERVAASFAVDRDRFRRWIAFHEVAHAAEFGAAPWLATHLESTMEETIERMASGQFDRESLAELNTVMTAVEGYAELVMDRSFDREYDDLREKLDARRRRAGPISQILRRLLGFGLKRQQYEQGKAFFDAVADARGIEGASVVWDRPGNLPSSSELDDPDRWIRRVDP
ncbi:MAG: zinc-dependent metalloprotease [Natronomonas sp.]